MQQNSRQAVPSVSGANRFFSAYATTRGSCPKQGKNRGKKLKLKIKILGLLQEESNKPNGLTPETFL
jgi:hypothetical protein